MIPRPQVVGREAMVPGPKRVSTAALDRRDNSGGGNMRPLPLCHIGISCTDMARTTWWYQRALGFLPSGKASVGNVGEPVRPFQVR